MTYPSLLPLRRRAAQQPAWDDPHQLAQVRNVLSATDALVRPDQIVALRRSLERVFRGEALVLQIGDCAEHPGECTEQQVAAKCRLVHQLAELLGAASGLPVVRVGRIAGQFAKPRSSPFEELGGVALPAYRGHLVNAPEFDAVSRRADPLRMLMCFMAAREAMQHLGWRSAEWVDRLPEHHVWTSHEALLLDYEQPQIRRLLRRRWMLSSTHWPWIGERTRQVNGAHVDLLSRVVNPVGCKVGPTVTPAKLLKLCRRLDPYREPGRLTLIVRMGATAVADRLPALVQAVRDDGHPVIWLSDPMHGNTVKLPDGTKTRHVDTVVAELNQFRAVLDGAGVPAGGMHLETTPHAVAECVGGTPGLLPPADPLVAGSPSLCDPRLNPDQAAEVVASWSGVVDPRAESLLTSEK